MKDLKLTITINKPAKDIFDFTLNPKNTPRWVESFVIEETNEWPPKLGTIYRNQNQAGEWSEYELTEFEPSRMFVLRRKGGGHGVRYVFKPLNENATELTYNEWMDEGEPDKQFAVNMLEKLKRILEGSNE